MMKNSIFKRVTALFAVLSVLMTSIPMLTATAASAIQPTVSSARTADPSTMDDWMRYFAPDELSTENTGSVWTDKSVFTDASAFNGTGIAMKRDDGFLVALSAMASTTVIDGLQNVPTDTMLVLDLSSGVYQGALRDPSVVSAMVQSVNTAIARLQAVNRYNRVGVVVYFGGDAFTLSSSTSARVLLPLGRYIADNGGFITADVSGGKLLSVSASAKTENGQAVTASQAVADTAGAYMQAGILTAMNELLSADPIVPDNAPHLAGKTRIPVMVLASASAPTAATADYTQIKDAGMGNNAAAYRNPVQTDFVTQLTAAYAKARLNEHYADTKPLVYTLSIGDDVSADVMDPKRSDTVSQAVLATPENYTDSDIEAAIENRAVDGYWNLLLNDGAVDITVQNRDSGGHVTDATYTVARPLVTVDGQAELFPWDKSQKYYVDQAFSASDATAFADAVDDMLLQMDIASHYHPTMVTEDDALSGYISFVDKIGQYMSVTDIKGILIDNTLFSGAMLSKNFVKGGGDLGTYDDPKSLGDELVWAVQERLGIDGNTARDLLGLAYAHGQLSYVNDQNFSNYIGWYANAAGQYLGFWYDGITSMPDVDDPTLTDATRPAYIIKSYGFLGAVDEKHGVSESDMMYATVQVRTHIQTGEESVAFAVPAALIPMVTYNVTLDENDELSSFELSGAQHPIRLVYEVALDEAINSVTVTELVDNDYIHKNADGTYDFYTNQFEKDGSVGYGKVNTYSYFIPSYENSRYYYTENTTVYADQNGTPLTGAKDPNGTYYRAIDVYKKHEETVRAETVYERISAASLAKAEQHEDGTWFIPINTVHTMLDNYVVYKETNTTDSLRYVNDPFVDTQYTYYVGATLGNNGRVTVTPETGLKLSKTVDGDDTDEAFAFTLVRTDTQADNASYRALLIDANGTSLEKTVTFENSEATVSLASGETLYILGMQAGAVYTVSEQASEQYKLLTLNGEAVASTMVTVNEHEFAAVHAVNAKKGTGNLIITKEVSHSFGAAYDVPHKEFTLHLSFGKALAGQTFVAEFTHHDTLHVATLDENGDYTFVIDHDEQFEFFGLPEGTQVTVTEIASPAGFTPVYTVNGNEGNTVTIEDRQTATVVVTGVYEAAPVDPVNVRIDGHKTLVGRENNAWTQTDVYQFELQRYENGDWVTFATTTVDQTAQSFNFHNAMAQEVFDKPGAYSYQVVETFGSVNGIVYDRAIHTFTVVVRDVHMDGDLNIVDVHSNVGDLVSGNEADGWIVTANFTNTYDADTAQAVVDIDVTLDNPTGSTLASREGFTFGLFDGDTPVFTSVATDAVGETRLIAEFHEIGTFIYTLKQVVPDNKKAGVTYDAVTYTAEINVTDNGDGTIGANVVLKDENGKIVDGHPAFHNVYAPKAATLAPVVTVTLDGRDLRDGEFTVNICDGDTVLAAGNNDADGDVDFDKTLSFDTVGDYYYTVSQAAGTTAGITYDDTVFTHHVTVRDGGDGSLTATYHVANVVGDQTVFRNLYKAAATTLTVRGIKTLVGRELINDEFGFVLMDADGPQGLFLSAFNRTDGTFVFEPIAYDTVGTYVYTLQELQSSTTHGITFDQTMYDITVAVYDDGDGVLKTDMTVLKDGEEVDTIEFVNTYQASPALVTFDGTKTLDGRVLGDGEFSFSLYEADDTWQTGETLETVRNTADGSFAFDTLTLDSTGVYRYVVKEDRGGETVDGVTYDDEVYRVMIVVTDNRRGQLLEQTVILNSANEYVTTMTFDNVYKETPPVTPPTTSSTTTTTTVPTTSTTAQKSPQTGDTTNLLLWIALAFVSGGVIVTLKVYGQKRTE